MIKHLFFLIICLFSFFPRDSHAAVSTYAQAMAECEAYRLADHYSKPITQESCSVRRIGTSNDGMIIKYGCIGNNCILDGPSGWANWAFRWDTWDQCPVGQSAVHDRWVPVGETGSSVVACAGNCTVVWRVTWRGSALVKDEVYSGAMCPANHGDPAAVDPPVDTETTNPDGSTTWCDGAGVCVTGPAPATSAPAPASSAPNNSTSTTTTTTHPATSSSTTTTTTSTTTTGGDGGSGDGGQGGTSTTESTSHAVTDTPAHESESESKCEGGVCDVGDADGELGHVYTSSGVTVDTLYGNFRRQVASTPIMSAVDRFFDVGSVSGECPTWHIPGNKYWGDAGFDFDFLCRPEMLSIFSAVGLLVLAMGVFSAFRIAIY